MWISLANHHLPSPDERRSFFSFCHCPTEILLRNYVTTCNLRSFIYYLCLYIMIIYSVVIIGICTYLIFQRSASVHSIICCQKSSDHLLPCPFFKIEKRKQSAMSTRLLHQTFPTGYYAFHRHTQRLSNEPPSLRNFGLFLKNSTCSRLFYTYAFFTNCEI